MQLCQSVYCAHYAKCDTFCRMSGGTYTGAATYSFIQAIERGGIYQTYANLIAAMSTALQQATGSTGSTAGGGGGIFGLLLASGFLGGAGGGQTGQQPILSASSPIDMNMRLMI